MISNIQNWLEKSKSLSQYWHQCFFHHEIFCHCSSSSSQQRPNRSVRHQLPSSKWNSGATTGHIIITASVRHTTPWSAGIWINSAFEFDSSNRCWFIRAMVPYTNLPHHRQHLPLHSNSISVDSPSFEPHIKNTPTHTHRDMFYKDGVTLYYIFFNNRPWY